MTEAVERLKHCPTCGSPDPHLHPAVQYGGEVSICADAFHSPRTKPAEGEPVAWPDREAVARKAEELILSGLFDHPHKKVHGAMLSTVHLVARDIAATVLTPLYTRPVAWPDRATVAKAVRAKIGNMGGMSDVLADGLASEIADAILALSASAPEGYKLVPVEPTEAMLRASWRQAGESEAMWPRYRASMARHYAAMLSASAGQVEGEKG